MSRYRPPRPAASPYITREGFQRLQAELAYLWHEKRPEVTAKVAEAAAQGDRSENAEYIYGKKQLREIDGRIRYLTKRLETLQVIDTLPADRTTVYFGAWVTLESMDGEAVTYRVVGADEFDADPRYISVDAPLARAVIGRSLDDEVVVQRQVETRPRVYTPEAGPASDAYVIVAIDYAP